MGSRPLISGGLTERYPGLTGSVLFSSGDFGAGDVPQTRQRVIQKCSERATEIIMGPIRIGVPVVFTSAVADHTVGAGGALCRFFHAPAKEILCFLACGQRRNGNFGHASHPPFVEDEEITGIGGAVALQHQIGAAAAAGCAGTGTVTDENIGLTPVCRAAV